MAARTGSTTDDSSAVMVRMSCAYSRGSAHVAIGNLQLAAGVYALAGPNGSGKSTLLSILSPCARGGALQPGISLAGDCVAHLPSTDLVEVTQRQWCPLHSAPIRWVARSLPGEPSSHAGAAAALLLSLRFDGRTSATRPAAASDGESQNAHGGTSGGTSGSTNEVVALAEQLTLEHEDYCGGLSGGQRAKLELVRAVFLQPSCPALLLLDEVSIGHRYLPLSMLLSETLITPPLRSPWLTAVSRDSPPSPPPTRMPQTALTPPSLTAPTQVFAPLDPASKALVMRRLRSFCASSVVLAVYHPDSADELDAEATGGGISEDGTGDGRTGQGSDGAGGGGANELCEAGVGGFFDGVLEVQDGALLPMRACRGPAAR